MLRKLLSVVAMLLCLGVFAQTQIPNGGFETWSGGNPTGWGSSDKVLTQLFQPDPGGVEQETTAVFAGTSAVRITNKEVTLPTIGTRTIPGVVSLGTLGINLSTFMPTVTGISYTDRPDSVIFAAKYTKAVGSSDTGGVIVTLTRWEAGERKVIANNIVRITDLASYTVFVVKVEYHSYLAPDTLLIQGLSALSQSGVKESTLWLDDLHFTGLDTAFKAYVFPFFDRNACDGDTVELTTDNIAGDTYQWYNGSTLLNGANTNTYTVTGTGDYSVVVVHNSTTYPSDTVTLTYHPLPTGITFTLTTDTVCRLVEGLALSGGAPSPGRYSGDGVNNNEFSAPDAGTGSHTITYTHTDVNGCSASATQTMFVAVCTGIEVLVPGMQVNVYPNPASNVLVVETNQQLNGSSIEVYDVLGKLMIQQNVSSTVTNLNVQGLPAGAYNVRLINAEAKIIANANVVVSGK